MLYFENEEVTFKVFSKMLVKESGCKPIKSFSPIKVVNFIASVFEKQALKTGKEPLMTTFSAYNLERNNDFDSSKAKKE